MGGAPQPAGNNYNSTNYNSNFSALYPNLGATQAQAASNTLSRLRGELSPETLNTIQDTAARFGITSGIPLGTGGNTVTGNLGRRLTGLTSEGLQSQGLQDYLNTLGAYSGTLMPRPGDIIGAETSRYSTDVGARTAADALSEQARQFTQQLRNRQAEFGQTMDLDRYRANAQNQQFYAGLDRDYLNSYLNFLG